jgi:hypothetical protein
LCLKVWREGGVEFLNFGEEKAPSNWKKKSFEWEDGGGDGKKQKEKSEARKARKKEKNGRGKIPELPQKPVAEEPKRSTDSGWNSAHTPLTPISAQASGSGSTARHHLPSQPYRAYTTPPQPERYDRAAPNPVPNGRPADNDRAHQKRKHSELLDDGPEFEEVPPPPSNGWKRTKLEEPNPNG